MDELWNPPQALAWIIWRSIDRVINVRDYRWTSMDVMDAALREADGEDAKWQEALSAREDFLLALCEGRLKAAGVSTKSAEVATIPGETWRGIENLHQFASGIGSNEIGLTAADGKPIVLYRQVTLLATDIQRIWRKGREKAPVRKTIPGPAVKEFLQQEIAKRGGYITQEEGVKIVRAQFPNVSREQVRPIIKELTKNDKRGPRGPRKIRPD